MIKILSGWQNCGGSTVAHCNLVNLFRENGLDAVLLLDITKPAWPGINCHYAPIQLQEFKKDDVLIYHFINLQERPDVSKVILSCHETTVFPIKEFKPVYDTVHFVSEYQKEWQGVDGIVIPNVLPKLTRPKLKICGVAGVVGSIDKNKRTHLSIKRALEDGFDKVRIYGGISDKEYFEQEVKPLLNNNVQYFGVSNNQEEMYSSISDVYHSPLQETFNLIKFECASAGVEYHGDEGNDTKAEALSDSEILEKWKSILSL